MHDVAVMCEQEYGGHQAHGDIAVSLVGGPVLEYFFSEETRGRWTGRGVAVASARPFTETAQWLALWALAADRAQRAIHRALTDGSARINAMAQPPQGLARPWIATPPLWATRPAEPGAPTWRHWTISPSIGDFCPPPLCLDATRYASAVAEVYETSLRLTSEQKRIAEDWNLDAGSVTPPGVWMRKLMARPEFQALRLVEQTSVLSVLSTAMLDAFTACWHVKFKWWTERPVTAIRRAYNKDFVPYVVTPSFPSYTSGHATVSAAAATVLASFFPQHRSDWDAAAHEAAESRLFGGIHFRFDNEEGLALGAKVGQAAVQALLRA